MATTYHNAGLNLSQATSASAAYSASGEFLTAASGETLLLKNIQIANDTRPSGSTYYDLNVCVKLQDASTAATHSLGYFMKVPKFSSLDVLSDNLVLEPSDKVIVQITGSAEATLTYRVGVVGSYLKIT